jgi:hypothetical protein
VRGAAGPFSFAQGWPTSLAGDTPAAGAGFTLAQPGRYGWQLIAVTFRLVTSAAVANRFVSVDYDHGQSVVFMRHPFSQAVTAGTTAVFSFQAGRGSSDWNANNDAALPLTPYFFQPGERLQIAVANIDVADQIDRVRMLFNRYPSGPEPDVEALLGQFVRASG